MLLRCQTPKSSGCGRLFRGSVRAHICPRCYNRLIPEYPRDSKEWYEERERREERLKKKEYFTSRLIVSEKKVRFKMVVARNPLLSNLTYGDYPKCVKETFHSHCHLDVAMKVQDVGGRRDDGFRLTIGPPMDMNLLNREIVGLYLI